MPKANEVLDRVATMPVGPAGFAAVSRVRRSAGGRYSAERRTSDFSEHIRQPGEPPKRASLFPECRWPWQSTDTAWVLIVPVNVTTDRLLQFAHITKDATPNALVG